MSDSLDREPNWLTFVMCPTPNSGHVKIICKVTTLWYCQFPPKRVKKVTEVEVHVDCLAF